MHHLASLRAAACRFARNFSCIATVLKTALAVTAGLSSAAQAQTVPAFPGCSGDMYLAQNPAAPPTTLYRFNTSTNPFVYTPLGTAPYQYNAIAFNPADNYIYGTASDGTQNILLRIGSNGQAQNLGPITGGGINNALAYHNGEIGSDGFYYLYKGDGTLFRVNLTTRTATAIPMSSAPFTSDLAWYNGLLYGQTGTGQLVSINPNNGVVTNRGPVQTHHGFGAMFSASNGIYGSSNYGGFYKINPVTGASTLISSSPPSSNNDGAKCYSTPLQFPADIAVTKTDGRTVYSPGETITYSIVVRNAGPFGVAGAIVNDPLPAGIITATWTCGAATNGGVCGAASGNGAISGQSVDLPVNASVTYTLALTLPPDFTGDLTNTVTVTNPPDSPDPNTSNNTATDTDMAGVPALTLDKTGTLNDLNGNALIDLGETITYSFLVTNTGNVTMTNVTVDDPLLANAGVALDQGPQTLAPGASFTFTATYTPVQADIDAGSVVNTATGTGTPPSGPPTTSPPDTVTVPPARASLHIEKKGIFNDGNGDGYASLGDSITYTFTITNNGGVTVTDVWPRDAGPTFNGRPAGSSLTSFQPSPVTLAPGASQIFTATYTLSQSDIDNAAGVKDAVSNSATAQGVAQGGNVPSNTSTSVITPSAAPPSDISIVKQSQLRYIRRGERAPYAIRVTNNANRTVSGVTVTDTLPSGFRYVEGSATVDGVKVTPVVNGLRVKFENLSIGPNSELVIRLQALALSSAGPGQHINRAVVMDETGTPLAPEARATVEILAEPVFDCGEIIGKVFDDVNRNGYQDEGEPGLPGVRVATVKGWLITTDKYGRFHVPCAALPDQRIGSNFIMKLDTRTLPTGYRLTTENPRVVRLTAGKMSKLNFGASIGRVVRLDLKDAAFEGTGTALKKQWAKGIDQLITVLAKEESVLRLSYIDKGADPQLAKERINELRKLIDERWKRSGARYPLEIETRMEMGQ